MRRRADAEAGRGRPLRKGNGLELLLVALHHLPRDAGADADGQDRHGVKARSERSLDCLYFVCPPITYCTHYLDPST